MKYLVCALAFASWLVLPAPVSAVSISGIVLYTTDDFGTPNGFNTIDKGELQAQLWRTALGGEWHILGVWNGLPPQSLGTPPLNGPDFMVEIPLTDGENDFTLVGQPGANTRVDEYERFAINLYLDGALDHPGISVLFPRNNSPAGSPTSPNRSDLLYSLALNQVKVAPQTTYDDGVVSVSVMAVSFLPGETFGDFDLVSPQSLVPSGTNDLGGIDYVGALKVMVGPSANPAGQQVLAPGAQGAGIIPGGIADGGTLHGPDIPIGGVRPGLVGEPGLGVDRGGAGGGARTGSDVALASGEAEPTAAAVETGTPGGTRTPAKTPSPNATSASGSPTASAGATGTPGTTGTPAATRASTTPAPHASTTVAVPRPTAGSRSK